MPGGFIGGRLFRSEIGSNLTQGDGCGSATCRIVAFGRKAPLAPLPRFGRAANAASSLLRWRISNEESALWRDGSGGSGGRSGAGFGAILRLLRATAVLWRSGLSGLHGL